VFSSNPRTLTSSQRSLFRQLAADYGTPLYVYDAETIRAQYRKVAHFDNVRFAQKACSNVHILRLLRELGASVDCVSAGELERALRAGFAVSSGAPEHAPIVYTADVISKSTLDRVVQLGIPVNTGSEDMLEQVGYARSGHPVWLRVNPGFGHGHSKKTNTGGESSKHGIWVGNLGRALEIVQERQLNLVGLHMHIGSGVDMGHLGRVCDAMERAVEVVAEAGLDLAAISGGGGLTIPYRSEDREVDPQAYFQLWDITRKRIATRLGHPVTLELEPGRFLVAQAGYLLTEVLATKFVGANHFTLVDAGFNDLVRPAMYGAFHELSIVAADDGAERECRPTVVAGPLCESGDVFTQNDQAEVEPRRLPAARVGDLLVMHDTGAYGASMSSNYNSRPLCAEVLLDGGQSRLIRRRQTIEELLALEDV
jgi:diaminopimelate decarboxylase